MTRVRFLVSIPDKVNVFELTKAFESLGDIGRIEIKEKVITG
jgi:hypothetical protein